MGRKLRNYSGYKIRIEKLNLAKPGNKKGWFRLGIKFYQK